MKRDDIVALGAKALVIFYLCAFGWILAQAPSVIVAVGVSPRVGLAAFSVVFGMILILAALAWGMDRALKSFLLPGWGLIALRILSWFVLVDGLATLVFSVTAPLPGQSNLPGQIYPGARLGLFLFALYLLRIGAEWFYRFHPQWTRRHIVDAIAMPGLPPLSKGVRVAAWLFIADGCLCFLLALLGWPAAVAGEFKMGVNASTVYAVYCVAELLLGVGVLRHSELMRKLALGYLAVGILNVLSYVLIPGAEDRLVELLGAVTPGLAGPPFEFMLKLFWILMTFALFSRVALIWPLLSVRRMPLARALRRPIAAARK
jgi:hypothetical protein